MSDKEEWCVWEEVGGDYHVERCLVRIQCTNGYAAYMAAIIWAMKHGYSGEQVVIDGPPRRSTTRELRQICYDTAPVEKLVAWAHLDFDGIPLDQLSKSQEYLFKKWALSA